MNASIALIDDDPSLLEAAKLMLGPQASEWDIFCFDDSSLAWQFLQTNSVDAVVTDLTMPGLSGIELLQRLRSSEIARDVPVVMMTGQGDSALKSRVLDLGATDLLCKPFHSADLLSRLRSMLRLKAAEDELRRRNRDLDAIVKQRTEQLQRSRLQIIWRLGKAAEFRDEETGDHIVRVACYSQIAARAMCLPEDDSEEIFLAAPLHDIGKLGIPDSILLKPGTLTAEERRIMQSHCELGARILSEPGLAERCLTRNFASPQTDPPVGDTLLDTACAIALSHHERWDGGGYPYRLRQEQIPLAARIVAVADVFDALTSARPYKHAIPLEEALRLIADDRGSQFDPAVVAAFLDSRNVLADVRIQVAKSRLNWDSWPERHSAIDCETFREIIATADLASSLSCSESFVDVPFVSQLVAD